MLIVEFTELTYTFLISLVLQGLLDLMITEEQELKQRLVKNIESYRQEINKFCNELQLPPFEVQSHPGNVYACFLIPV